MTSQSELKKHLAALELNDTQCQMIEKLIQEREAAAQNKIDHLNGIIDRQPLFICCYDREGRVTFVNQTMLDYYKLSKAEVIGQSFLVFVPEAEYEEAKKRLAYLLEAPRVSRNQFLNPTPSGERQWYEWVDQSIVDEAGNVIGVQGNGYNVHDARTTQSDMHRHLEQYRILVQNIPSTTVLVFNRRLRYELAEGPLVNEMGLGEGAMEGRSFYNTWDQAIIDQIEAHYKSIFEGKSARIEMNFQERSFEVSFSPLREANGKILNGLVVIYENTRERQALRELREREERLSIITENMSEVFFLYDIHADKLVYVSSSIEGAWGFRADDVKANYEMLLPHIHPEDFGLLYDTLWDDNIFRSPNDIQFRLIVAGESDFRWVRLRTIPVEHGNSGRPDHLVGIAEDVTLQRQAEQNAIDLALERERTRIMTRFIDMAAHEFRTPLSIILTNVYLMEQIEDTERRHTLRYKVEGQINSLMKLVDGLVTMSKLDGGITLQRYPLSVRTVIHDILAALERESQRLELKISTEISDDPLQVVGDSRFLGQAIRNVIENAMQHTPKGGSITIRAYPFKDGVEISISDTGIGMSSEIQAQIFNRFFRADSAHTTKGFGLGLPMTRKILDMHGGNIRVESSPKQGSTFTLFVPINYWDQLLKDSELNGG